MRTYRECLAKANEMEACRLTCSPTLRQDYAGVARGWRRAAKLALAQEKAERAPGRAK
jgi:hypothetical protein